MGFARFVLSLLPSSRPFPFVNVHQLISCSPTFTHWYRLLIDTCFIHFLPVSDPCLIHVSPCFTHFWSIWKGILTIHVYRPEICCESQRQVRPIPCWGLQNTWLQRWLILLISTITWSPGGRWAADGRPQGPMGAIEKVVVATGVEYSYRVRYIDNLTIWKKWGYVMGCRIYMDLPRTYDLSVSWCILGLCENGA